MLKIILTFILIIYFGCAARANNSPENNKITPPSVESVLQQFDKLIDQAFYTSRDSAKFFYQQAEILSDSLLQLFPGNSQVLARAAIAQVQLLGFENTRAKIQRVQKIDDYSLQAIHIDSTNSIALVIQGIMNYRLSNLSWIERFIANTFIGSLPETSYEKSIEYLEKAIRYDNKSAYYYFALGRTLLAIDDFDGAVMNLQIAASLPVKNQLERRFQNLAKRWLENIEQGTDFDLHHE